MAQARHAPPMSCWGIDTGLDSFGCVPHSVSPHVAARRKGGRRVRVTSGTRCKSVRERSLHSRILSGEASYTPPPHHYITEKSQQHPTHAKICSHTHKNVQRNSKVSAQEDWNGITQKKCLHTDFPSTDSTTKSSSLSPTNTPSRPGDKGEAELPAAALQMEKARGISEENNNTQIGKVTQQEVREKTSVGQCRSEAD